MCILLRSRGCIASNRRGMGSKSIELAGQSIYLCCMY